MHRILGFTLPLIAEEQDYLLEARPSGREASITVTELGTHQAKATDADGDEGIITITFKATPPDTFVLDDDYSSWEKHSNIVAQTLTRRIESPTEDTQIRSIELPDGVLYLQVMGQWVRRRGSRAYGRIDWTTGPLGACSFHGFDPEAGVTRGLKQLRPVWTAVQVVAHVKVGRGGRPLKSRKGRPWKRECYLTWYGEASQSYAMENQPLTLQHLGEAMGVSTDTARRRLKDVGLPWPPEAHLETWLPDPDE